VKEALRMIAPEISRRGALASYQTMHWPRRSARFSRFFCLAERLEDIGSVSGPQLLENQPAHPGVWNGVRVSAKQMDGRREIIPEINAQGEQG